MVGFWRACCLGAVAAGLLLVACQQKSSSETAVSPPPASSTTAVYLPITQSQPAATAVPPPTDTPAPTLTPACAKSGNIVESSLPSQWAGTFNYRVYYPPCYSENGQSYPTLYLLPGNIHTDSIWQDLGLLEAANQLFIEERVPPFLVVMADGGWIAQNTSGGPGSYESVIRQELIPHIETETCAWAAPQARAIGGLSRGGYWALEIAFRHPADFAGVGGHSAALVDTYAGPDINPRYTGLSQPLGSLQVYLDIGRSDYLIAPLRALHEAMVAQEIAHTWLLNEGTHEEAYWAAHLSGYLHWYAALWPAMEAAPPCQP